MTFYKVLPYFVLAGFILLSRSGFAAENIRSNLKELHLVPSLNGNAYLLENLIDMFVKHSSTILRRKYEMVQKYRNILTLMDVIAHPYNLRRKRRGIQP